MKNVMSVLAALLFTLSAAAEAVSIALLPGECWWGGTVGGGWKMPLGEASVYRKDLRVDSDGNQAAPLLLSTKGRWVWCEDAFLYAVSNGVLTVTTGPAPRSNGNAPHPMDVAAALAGEAKKDEASPLKDVPNLALTCYSKTTWAPIQTGTASAGNLRAAYLECSRRFFPPKGMPRAEFFRQPILNTWVELNYNQNEKDVLAYAQSFLDNGMKPGVLMIDCFWQTDAFGPWVFHAGRFRDPKGLVDRLHAMGFKVMLWHAPFVTMDAVPYRLLRDEGGLLVDSRLKRYGRAYQGLPIQWWDGYSAVYDPTSPAGRAWYRGVLKRLMDDYGVDGFFFDGAGPHEFPPGDYVAHERTAQPTDLVRAFQSVALEVPFQQLREAWKLGGEPIMNTLRDKQPKWSEVRRCVADMIAAGQLGYPFVVADLVGGGTCGNNGKGVFGLAWQEELFIRHLEVECLSPMIQFSGSPWRLLSPAAQGIVRDLLALRARFAPYVEKVAEATGRTGLPMLRSLDFQYPGNGYERVLDQFLLGDDLLVAPVVEGGVTEREVLIPPGRWRDAAGKTVEGPARIRVSAPLATLPHFLREGGSL